MISNFFGSFIDKKVDLDITYRSSLFPDCFDFVSIGVKTLMAGWAIEITLARIFLQQRGRPERISDLLVSK